MNNYEGVIGRQLNYKDVMLEPRFSTCNSRSEIDLSTKLGDHTFKSPIMPANMKTVIDEKLAIELAKRGYFYVMHRFGVDNFEFVKSMYDKGWISSISVGVNGVDRELIKKLSTQNLEPSYITIDIAHGNSQHMIDMIQYIKDRLQDTFLIAGNVCNVDAVRHLAQNGADCIKVGVGPGHACTTKLMTGFFRPQFSAVMECCDTRWNANGVPIIADGGIEHNGDIAKAMVAGAHMVMCGHLLAAHDESPGEKMHMQHGHVKEYYGSSSEHNSGMKKHVEGRRLYIQCRGSIFNTYDVIEESLRSSCSYAGVERSSLLKGTYWREI
jgi:GMP reductase